MKSTLIAKAKYLLTHLFDAHAFTEPALTLVLDAQTANLTAFVS